MSNWKIGQEGHDVNLIMSYLGIGAKNFFIAGAKLLFMAFCY